MTYTPTPSNFGRQHVDTLSPDPAGQGASCKPDPLTRVENAGQPTTEAAWIHRWPCISKGLEVQG